MSTEQRSTWHDSRIDPRPANRLGFLGQRAAHRAAAASQLVGELGLVSQGNAAPVKYPTKFRRTPPIARKSAVNSCQNDRKTSDLRAGFGYEKSVLNHRKLLITMHLGSLGYER
jgi:hypothetical protein